MTFLLNQRNRTGPICLLTHESGEGDNFISSSDWTLLLSQLMRNNSGFVVSKLSCWKKKKNSSLLPSVVLGSKLCLTVGDHLVSGHQSRLDIHAISTSEGPDLQSKCRSRILDQNRKEQTLIG
ncbi:hypothetical protein CHARACLAT_006274 [Characodon lateralis]|uniref:Uncharacterized protein n=1 Tax=Characodon lateralis TaxID=208331 RepID=A0ABU7DNT1_9TELE|nr:hypothetical protein [Characodon lateralis]